MNSQITQESLDWVILKIAISSMHLEGIVDDVETFVSGEFLGHCAVHGVVWVPTRYQVCTMSYHETTGLEIRSHSRQLELDVLVIAQWLTKLFTLLDIIFGNLKGFGSSTNRAACNIESATIKSGQSYLETLSSFADHVLFRYNNIIEIDLFGGLNIPAHLALVSSVAEAFHTVLKKQT